LYVLHTDGDPRAVWEQLPPSPGAPRSGHTCTALGKSLWIIGGYYNGCYRNDVLVYDTEAKEWDQVSVGGAGFAPRCNHSSVAVGPLVYVFGGSQGNWLNDLMVLDTEHFVWGKIQIINSIPPPPRMSHTCIAVPSVSQIWLFGSEDHHDPPYSLFKLDLNSWQWTRVTSPGAPLSSSCGQAAAVLCGGHVKGLKEECDVWVFGCHPSEGQRSFLSGPWVSSV